MAGMGCAFMQSHTSATSSTDTSLSDATKTVVSGIGPVLAALVVVFWGLRIWMAATVFPWIGVVSSGVILGGLVLPLVAVRWPRSRRAVEGALFVLAAAALVLWTYWRVFQNPAYGTDELAFDQYAAQLWMHGINPYLASMAPAFQQFLVPPIFHTFTLTGHTITQLSYPALSFLAYVPALALGLRAQAAVWVDVAFWVLANAMLYWLLPRGYRWIAIITLSFVQYINYVVGGVTDALFLPFLLLALWQWDRFGDPEIPRWRRVIGPIALGLAMAIKQTPWFFAPFLSLGIVLDSLEKHRPAGKIVGSYVAIAAATFFVANLPFDVISMGPWLHGTLLPLMANTVPSGEGLITVTLAMGLGGGLLRWYDDAGLLLVVWLLAVLLFRFPRAKVWWPLAIPIVFFWTSRSFASYLIDLFPAALIGILSVSPGTWHPPARLRMLGPLAISALSLAFVGLVALALGTPAPLSIRILGTVSSGQFSTIQQLEIRAVNRTDEPVRPHFTVDSSGYLTSFWIVRGPRVLAAHQVGLYHLVAPNTQSMPGILSGFQVMAMTASPPAVSTSAVFVPRPYSVVLSPDAVNHLVALHHELTFVAQLRNRVGQPVERAGVPVAIGQVIYGQQALIPAEAQINGAPEGATPVEVRTNQQGRAVFRIVGDQYQGVPIYFEAYVSPPNSYPYGYSNIVIVNFSR